ncbi:aminotransferase class I and II [Emticicia oligotrophica DSM 17448]|uniref:Aminotransferase class I and II n=1 Tax=Emticicia oligotrophica (strain DSM 17448 / CIP 109782 / MTCC 6937 / GPTSA100-15) TaxID=929562 RepID=A0ABN4AM12_EMTOG|nr:aminotransferase class I/II-fold pyridoxal phosphate-dependent enzyme [Emticicia oligotrophica]AFK03277.1 aminotransferase class I and II [Emticicia oligotrophica DSM 17448]
MPNEFIINQLPSNKILIEEKEYHFYSGTSYLGLNQDADFKHLLIEGINRYGMSFGSSRNGNLQLDIYAAAEEKMARWVGAEKALTVSSGMLAGQVVAQFLKTQDSTFFYAPSSHAANFHEPNVVLPNISFENWAENIAQEISENGATHSVIVCNSCDALKLTPYHFDWTVQLPQNQKTTLIIDDSHGLGITGDNGAGVFQNIFVNANVRLVVVSSLHKAMGIAGGVIFSDSDFIEQLRHTAFFSSCSPITPAYLYAYMHADDAYSKNQQKLKENIARFTHKLIENQGIKIFNYLEGYPVFYSLRDELYDFLFQHQILIYSFAYPIKTGKPNTRIVISAWHEAEQLDFLAEKIGEFTKVNS